MTGNSMTEKPEKNFDTLMRIFRRMGIRKGFFGDVTFIIKDGELVHSNIHHAKTSDDIRKLLDT
jgi:hypothetical protein